MKALIKGKCYVVGDNIDTDQIIPAQYLTYNPAIPEERKMFGKFALSGLPGPSQGLPKGGVPFVKPDAAKSEYKILIAGKNFGCGSSREHASVCLKEAGIEVVIAESYSRIFFRNSVNGGYFPPFEIRDRLCEEIETGDEAEVDIMNCAMRNLTRKGTYLLRPLGDILPILEAGDIFRYAKKVGLSK